MASQIIVFQFGANMTLRKHKPALAIVGLVVLLIIFVALLSNYWPKQEKWFIELGLLGNDMTADAYFDNANSIVDIGISNSWYIYLHNHLDSAQDVKVRVKLQNSTMELPDDRKQQFSNVPFFTEFSFSLSINETTLFPFSWSVSEAEVQTNSVVIDRLIVNDQPIDVNVSASFNTSFRIVFELWCRDPVSGEYQFGWESKEGFFSASLYMGFRIDSSSL